MSKITKICSTCGSTDVVKDAWASWNEATQEYELSDVFDNAYCNNCECECTIEDEELIEPENPNGN